MEPRKIVMALATFFCLFLTGCPLTGSGDNAAILDGTSWVLESLHGQPMRDNRHQLTLNFKNNKISGSAGCNDYYSSYTEESRGNLHIEKEVFLTEKACMPNEVMAQEGRFIDALKTTATYNIVGEIVGEKLTLKNAEGLATAVFIAQSQDLQGTSWQVTGYNNGSGIISILSGSTLNIAFENNGEVTGSAGCNTYFGAYTSAVSGRTVSISQAGLTRMDCPIPAGVMEQENTFLAALITATTYRIDGRNLTLSKADGSTAVNLKKN
jgi:heat shock protein HslJ